MKQVRYIREDRVESFSETLEKTLQGIEAVGFKIVETHILSDSRGIDGFTHCAYIIYE